MNNEMDGYQLANDYNFTRRPISQM